MKRKLVVILSVFALALSVIGVAAANPGQPSFEAGLYGDGELWSSKGTAALPAPNENNVDSFDKLFVITNSNTTEGVQLPVAEAAPGNPDFNGGRWFTHTAEWTEAGFAAHGNVPLIESYAELMVHYNLGHIEITAGSPEGGPPPYFQCPMLPVK